MIELSDVWDLGQLGEGHPRLENSISQGWKRWRRAKVSSAFKKMTLNFRHKKYWALVVRMKSITVADHWPEAHELQWWSCFLNWLSHPGASTELFSGVLTEGSTVTCQLGRVNWDFDLQCFLKAGWNVSEVVRCYWKWNFILENLSGSANFFQFNMMEKSKSFMISVVISLTIPIRKVI